jgi:hypothetical protein
MFRITTETCRRFTFGEVLIMAAMNVETMRSQSPAKATTGGHYGVRHC